MTTRYALLATTLLTCAVLAGCATSRSEVKVASPAVVPAAVASGPVIVIRSIKDERVFEQAPKDPGTPSLGFEGAAAAADATKARAIGRKRNTFGAALGDVLLENGQTVQGLVRDNLTAALQQAGYQVKAEDAAGPSPLVMDVHIRQFWAWLQPGWAIKLHGNVATELTLSGTESPVVVNVNIEESHQLVTDSDWMEIVGKALDAYRAQVVEKAAGFPKNSSQQ